MTISVVMATFNGAPYVEAQLRSILGQNRRPEEVIVCDDGSTDGTVALVRRVAGDGAVPVTVVEQPRRLGVTANVESGVRRAAGAIVVLADQDDVWRPDKLRRVEATLAGGQRHLMFSDGRILGTSRTLWDSIGLSARERRRLADDRALEQLLRWNAVTGATTAFTADLAAAVVPFSSAGLHDAWIGLIAAAAGVVTAVPDQLIEYRLHETNQAGVPPPSATGRLRERLGQRDLRSRESRFFDDVVRRLIDLGAPASAVAKVEAKRDFVRARSTLPASAPRRAVAVGRHLASGRYARYSKRAMPSAAYDLLFGGAPQGR